MHYGTLKNAIILGMAAFSRAEFMERDEYSAGSASQALVHIDAARTRYGDKLSDAQEAVLGFAEDIVNSFATDEIPELLKLCEDAFSNEECRHILGDDASESTDILDKRVQDCHCNTGADFCDNRQTCYPHRNGSRCNYRARGCGWLFAQYCNGICLN